MSRTVLRAPSLRWLPAIGAVTGAMGGAAAIAAMSAESLIDMTRLAGLETLPDPLVRISLGAVVLGSVCWAALYLIWGRGGPLDATQPRRIDPRRITVNRQTPAPWPIVAVDAVVPPPRERSLPADLDQPLSAFDPHSIPTMSFESIRRSGLRPTT